MKKINRRRFTKQAAMISAGGLLAMMPAVQSISGKKEIMKFRLLRHATLLVDVAGKKILVDPMLSKKDAMEPVKNAVDNSRIPMTELPFDEHALHTIITESDAVIVTHTHRDHWDIAAQQLIPKDKLILCQPTDEGIIKAQGFINIQPVEKSFTWNKIKFHRANGLHGTGDIGKAMGQVSGFVIDFNSQRLYIAGDTIWCSDVEKAISDYKPGHIIVNGGGAQFLQGDPITMTIDDVTMLSAFTQAKVSVVHLDTINHCVQKKSDFKKAIAEHRLTDQVSIPADGSWTTI